MQLGIHAGAALGDGRGHVDIVLVGALQAQLALPGFIGQLAGDVGLFLCDGGQQGFVSRVCAAVVKLADTRDLKSLSGDRVRVQAPPVA